jgi:outer membrane lipoprotein-sorting protein
MIMGIAKRWFELTSIAFALLIIAGTGPAFSQGSAAKESAPGKSPEAAAEKGSEAKGSAAKTEAAEVMNLIREKASQLKTVKANQTMSMAMMGQEITMTGEIMFAMPDKFRMEMQMPEVPAGKTVVVSNGTTTWTMMPQMNMVQKIDMKKVKEAMGEEFEMPGSGMGPGQSTPNFSNPFAEFKEGSVDYMKSEQVAGTECAVFEAKPEVPENVRGQMEQFMPKSVKIWIGKEDGMLRKQVFMNSQGEQMMEMTFDDITINPEIAEGTFEFTPSADAQVIDMTEMVINMSKSMMGGGEKGGVQPEGSAPKSPGSAPKSGTEDMKSEMEDRGI